MSITAVSTPYLGDALLPAVAQAQAQLAQLEIESTTGVYANLGEQLGPSSGYELSLRNTDDLLQSLTAAYSIISGRLSTASSAVNSVISGAQSTLKSLVAWQPGSNTSTELAATGDDAMQSLVASANATYDDQFVFGGINSSTPPLASFSASSSNETALISAFQTQFGFSPTSAAAANVTASQMTSFLNGPFASEFSGANWSNWSSASSTDESAEIAPGEIAETSTSLNSGGFQQLTEAYAMLATFGGSSLDDSAQSAVVSAATSLITEGLSGVTNVGTNVGAMQDQLKQADDNMSTQSTLIKTQIGGLDNVDPAQVATQLSTLTTQLETAYQATAQLQKLSLAQYLPT